MMMGMMKKVAIAGGAAAAALAMGVGPASAAGTTDTVSGGPNFTATSKGGDLVLQAGVGMRCTSGTAAGSVVPGTYTPPAQVGTITSTTWTGCATIGLPFTVTQNGTWQLWVDGTTTSGVTPGSIRNVDATISVSGICTIHVTGTASGSYNSNTHQLNLDGVSSLTVSSSGLCVGVSNPGHFTGEYDVTGSSSPINITTP